uniref:Uncharacterized protein n=1 Tax=Oryza meridionalis TaxID=40149 RepID=A0A0E0CSI9_9ORYZ
MATRVEMWALCASASGFSSEVWAVPDLKIVLAWLLVSETQNRRDFFTKGDTLVLHQLAVHLSVVCTIQQLPRDFLLDGTHLCLTFSVSHSHTAFRLVQIVNVGLRSHMTQLDLTDSEVQKRNPSVMTDDEVISRADGDTRVILG